MSAKCHVIPIVTALLGALLLSPAHGFSINKSIHVDSGSKTDGHSTVNGSITVESDAVVEGSLDTVNGKIRIGDNVTVRDANTVNGSIRSGSGLSAEDLASVNGSISIGEKASISGEVTAVNGSIDIGPGSSIARDVGNVNGDMHIEDTEIGGDLSTVTGDILLTDNSILRGDLVIEKPQGSSWWGRRTKPKIIIGPGTRVLGTIRAESEIDLYISETAEVADVTGEASMDKAVRFSGDRP